MNCKEFESLIDSYLDGTIPEEKSELFEEHYFLCDNCFSSLQISENLYNKKVHIVTGKKRRYSFVFKPSLVLASMILIVFSSLFVVDLNNRSEQLFKVSDFSPPLYIKGENRGEPTPSLFYEAMEIYQNGDYGKAYDLIRATGKGNSQICFFRGVLALLNSNSRDALDCFNIIINKMDPSYYDEALYFRGITYLRMNRKKDAVKEFKTLESMFSPLSKKASEKLKKLSEL